VGKIKKVSHAGQSYGYVEDKGGTLPEGNTSPAVRHQGKRSIKKDSINSEPSSFKGG